MHSVTQFNGVPPSSREAILRLLGAAALVLSSASILTGCGDGSTLASSGQGGNGSAASTQIVDAGTAALICQSMGGGISKAVDLETGAALQEVLDGDVSTPSKVAGGNVAAVAQPGVVYPSGSKATVMLTASDGAGDVEISTLLGGVVQDQGCVALIDAGDVGLSVVHLATNSPFDEIRVRSGSCGGSVASPGALALSIHEICSDLSNVALP